MSKIVITGATGFIGAPLVEKFALENHEVVALVRPNSKNMLRIKKRIGVQIIPIDMEEIENLSNYVKSADCFIHTAWEGIRGNARMDYTLQMHNYERSMATAKVAQDIGCKVFLGIGSQAEYGVTEKIITEETDETPNTEYGKMKLLSYQSIKERYEDTKMKIIWARVFSAYGYGDTPSSLIETCIQKMRGNEEVHLTECIQPWNYIYIDDVVEAIYRLATINNCEGKYNIASKDNRSLKKFVLELREVLNSDSKILFGAVPYGISGSSGFRVDISKLCKDLEWEPSTSFADGIQKRIRIEERNENN